MSAANVIQLRKMLSEKFPGIQMRLGEQPALKSVWRTGIVGIDEALSGGLPKGALTEVVGKNRGSATFLRELLSNAAAANQIVALIDGNDSLDVTQIGEAFLSRLLWVRCHSADESLKCADLVLRDGNASLVLLDLKFNPEKQLQKIPATVWYRLQRLVEETPSLCIIFTPRAMVSPAQTRITVRSSFSMNALDRNAGELVQDLKLEMSDVRQAAEPLQNTA